jgi:hypothetical protein
MAETILLVDDEEGIRKVLGISLPDPIPFPGIGGILSSNMFLRRSLRRGKPFSIRTSNNKPRSICGRLTRSALGVLKIIFLSSAHQKNLALA